MPTGFFTYRICWVVLTAMVLGPLANPSVATGQQLYFPLFPCRIVDTRIAFGEYSGPIGSRESVHYHAKTAAEISNQGGHSNGCGVPAGALALVVNISATQQSGPGHLRAYPYGDPIPNASILNYSDATIGNSTILPICTGTCPYDFSIYAYRSTHVVIDVMGYFAD